MPWTLKAIPSMGVQGGGTIEGADSRLAADLTSDEVPNITGHQVNGALASVPSAPTNLTATANGHTRIDLSWTLPRHHGAGAIAGYRIEVSFDAGASWSDLVADTGGNGRAYHHTGLSAETSRHYCVSAINPAGTGPASNVDDATTAAAPAAPATPEPRVSISADHASFIFALDDVRFTLTLAAAAGADLSVLVTLSQDQTMLPASALTRIATIGEGKTSGVLLVRSHLFTGNPTDSGTLTATVIDGGGYEPARPATASTSIRVADPAMTIRLEHARYHVAEAAGSVEVVAIAETAPGVPPPRGTHFFALSTEARTAEAGTDFETAVAFVLIQPADYRELGGVFMAEKTLAVSILDDEQDDDDEYFVVMLERGPGLSLVIHLVAPDQAACTRIRTVRARPPPRSAGRTSLRLPRLEQQHRMPRPVVLARRRRPVLGRTLHPHRQDRRPRQRHREPQHPALARRGADAHRHLRARHVHLSPGEPHRAQVIQIRVLATGVADRAAVQRQAVRHHPHHAHRPSAAVTRYSNVSVSVPEPPVYSAACTAAPRPSASPNRSPTVGVPPVVVTRTSPVNRSRTRILSPPSRRGPRCRPAAPSGATTRVRSRSDSVSPPSSVRISAPRSTTLSATATDPAPASAAVTV